MDFKQIVRTYCNSTTTEVFGMLASLGFEPQGTRNRRFSFRPGATATSPLIVCHADTVQGGGESKHRVRIDGDRVQSLALDDRLGISCMVHAIQSASDLADCAMLVCDDEEIGQSTAKEFATWANDCQLRPNWMVELDRRGTDVVMYEYESTLLKGLLEQHGWEVETGSISDICYLEDLGVIGFNCGIGYHNEHSKQCHADLRDTRRTIQKLTGFYNQFLDTRLEHDPPVRFSQFSSWGDSASYYRTGTKLQDSWEVDQFQEGWEEGYNFAYAEMQRDASGQRLDEEFDDVLTHEEQSRLELEDALRDHSTDRSPEWRDA